MKITKELIESTGFQTGLPDLAIGYLEQAMGLVQKGADHTECLKSWEARANIQLKTSERPKEPVVEESDWKC